MPGLHTRQKLHPARPSVTDLSMASPAFTYLIQATIGSALGSARCWTLNEESGCFAEDFFSIG